VNELLGLPECENWETDLHWDHRLEGKPNPLQYAH